jgi:frataxin-like iron-binding protein CyaY
MIKHDLDRGLFEIQFIDRSEIVINKTTNLELYCRLHQYLIENSLFIE